MSEYDDFLDRLKSAGMEETWRSVKENLDQIPLDDTLQELNQTSRLLHQVANPMTVAMTTDAQWAGALRRLRSWRRALPAIAPQIALGQLKVYLSTLLEMDDNVDDQIRALGMSLPMVSKEQAHDLAIEFLHFYSPRRYPLGPQWVYSWKTATGALPYLMEFTNQLGLNGQDRFHAYGANYEELFMRLQGVGEMLKDHGLHRWGVYSTDLVLAYLYADYLYKMYFTTSKSIFSTIPTVLGVISYLLGLAIPPQAVPTGVPVEAPDSWMEQS